MLSGGEWKSRAFKVSEPEDTWRYYDEKISNLPAEAVRREDRKLVEDGYFPNESEVFRDFTRKYLNDYLEDIREEVGAAGVRKE